MDLSALHDAPLGRLVAVAGHVISQQWSRFLAEHHGLTPAGLTTLITLQRYGQLTHRAVADHCFVRPATLTGIVDTLERDGLVERLRDEADRRTVRLALTPDGVARAEALTNVLRTQSALTSVDADPAKAAVIREFLLELIRSVSDGEGLQVSPTVEGREQPMTDQHAFNSRGRGC